MSITSCRNSPTAGEGEICHGGDDDGTLSDDPSETRSNELSAPWTSPSPPDQDALAGGLPAPLRQGVPRRAGAGGRADRLRRGAVGRRVGDGPPGHGPPGGGGRGGRLAHRPRRRRGGPRRPRRIGAARGGRRRPPASSPARAARRPRPGPGGRRAPWRRSRCGRPWPARPPSSPVPPRPRWSWRSTATGCVVAVDPTVAARRTLAGLAVADVDLAGATALAEGPPRWPPTPQRSTSGGR